MTLLSQALMLNTSDITERKRAEKEQRMRGQMQTLSDNSPDIILRIDLNRTVFYANPAIEKYTGGKQRNLLKNRLMRWDCWKNSIVTIDAIAEEIRRIKERSRRRSEFLFRGSKKIMNLNAIPEFNEEGKLETILFILHDITELKKD
jgi:PAS domain S-box-containing protein